MFSIVAAGFVLGDTTAFLKGTIGSGTNARRIVGEDAVNVVMSSARGKYD
jgi:hypothetical protein